MAECTSLLVDCNPLTPLLRFGLDLSYKLLQHCCAAVSKILTNMLRRAVKVAELLVVNVTAAGKSMRNANTENTDITVSFDVENFHKLFFILDRNADSLSQIPCIILVKCAKLYNFVKACLKLQP